MSEQTSQKPGPARKPARTALSCILLGCLSLGLVFLGSASAPPGVMPSAEAADEKTLDEYFKGKVTALEGKVVTLVYDFRRKTALKDFTDRVPFRIKSRKGQGIKWFDQKLQIIGNAGARHKAEWMGDIMVTATFTPDMEKDFGAFLSPVSETEDFATFTWVETFFHAFDKSAGGTNSIIKFGAQWRETDSEEYIGFRYVTRKPPKKKPVAGRAIRASFGLQKKKLIFTLPEYELKGSDKGKKLKRFYLGFYAIKGRLLIDNIEIKGRLATDWLKRERVAVRTSKPITTGADQRVDNEIKGWMTAHKAGTSNKATRELIEVLKDETRGAPVHQAVIGCLSTGPKKAVRSAIDLLYNEQVTVRDYGITIIKALLGKDYGFKAKASEKSRTKAIRAMNEDLKANPDMLKG